MLIAKTLSFYKRADVRNALVLQARDKEISILFGSYFGKRPEVLYADGDVLEFAKKKASSFHFSEELWNNPLFIKTGMSKKEIEDLRKGWDLILDIDCPYWPLAKLTTHLFIKALQAHGVKAVTVKFSGNKGFHIAVPFEAFPERVNGTPTKDLFPEAPRRIAHYLLDYLSRNYVEDMGDYLLFDKKYKMSKEKLKDKLGVNNFTKEVEVDNIKMRVFDPLTIIEVDTILIAHRHLYRAPYSFHEKSQLVSVPIRVEDVLTFKKKNAEPELVVVDVPFLEREVARPGEANNLFIEAYDFNPGNATNDKERRKYHAIYGSDDGLPSTEKEYKIPEQAIPKDYFPPCILKILEGLKDGRKRSMFTLINFFRGAGWSHEQIEEELRAWNERNDEPLREVEIRGRLRYEKQKKDSLPPHNCRRYYEDFQVCVPDNLCASIKNPLQYAKKKAKLGGFGVDGATVRQKLTDEQKEMRRAYREAQKKKEEKEENKEKEETKERKKEKERI